MGFSIPEKLLIRQQNQAEQSSSDVDRLDLLLLANGKRMGFSLAEMNEFRLRDFIELTNLFMGSGDQNETVRNATQGDIDKFFG